uniref:ORF51 n=1 Tax=Lymantria dispar multicapsid nuclear polyhedrosis virus TaxID=10449 RepID=A0A513WW99_NPVLD|nr:ORF51 [Lymantria dispar multiple nucleopolyhedrovirus]
MSTRLKATFFCGLLSRRCGGFLGAASTSRASRSPARSPSAPRSRPSSASIASRSGISEPALILSPLKV